MKAVPWLFVLLSGAAAAQPAADPCMKAYNDQVVAIEAVSTRPSSRGRRLGELVTASAVATALDVPAALLSSDLGRPVYRKLVDVPGPIDPDRSTDCVALSQCHAARRSTNRRARRCAA